MEDEAVIQQLSNKVNAIKLHNQTKSLIIDQRYHQQILFYLTQKYTDHDFFTLISQLNSMDISKQHRGVIGIRKLVSRQLNPMFQAVIDSGVVPKLVEMARNFSFPQLQYEALWTLSNICSGNSSQVDSVIKVCGVKLFMDLLDYPDKLALDPALWGLGNISCQSKYRNVILNNGVNKLINLHIPLANQQQMLINLGWVLSNMCRGNPLPKYQSVKDIIPLLCKFIKMETFQKKEQNLYDLLWAVFYQTEKTKQQKQMIINCNIIPTIIQLIQTHTTKQTLIPSLRIIGSLLSGDHQQTEQAIKQGVLAVLEKLIQNPEIVIRRETCWSLSNVAAGNSHQAQQLMANKVLMAKIAYQFKNDEVSVKKQICYIFANLTTNSDPYQLFNFIINYSILQSYLQLLITQDQKMLDITITCLTFVLQLGDQVKAAPGSSQNSFKGILFSLNAFNIFLELSNSYNPSISLKSKAILQKYFNITNSNNNNTAIQLQ